MLALRVGTYPPVARGGNQPILRARVPTYMWRAYISVGCVRHGLGWTRYDVVCRCHVARRGKG
jgi:hypothetical protein